MYNGSSEFLLVGGFPRRTSPCDNVCDTLHSARNFVARLRQLCFLFAYTHEPHDAHSLPADFETVQIPDYELRRANPRQLKFYSHYPEVYQPVVDVDKDQYEVSVCGVDAEVGKFLPYLKELPWFGNSLIIFKTGSLESCLRRRFHYVRHSPSYERKLFLCQK